MGWCVSTITGLGAVRARSSAAAVTALVNRPPWTPDRIVLTHSTLSPGRSTRQARSTASIPADAAPSIGDTMPVVFVVAGHHRYRRARSEKQAAGQRPRRRGGTVDQVAFDEQVLGAPGVQLVEREGGGSEVDGAAVVPHRVALDDLPPEAEHVEAQVNVGEGGESAEFGSEGWRRGEPHATGGAPVDVQRDAPGARRGQAGQLDRAAAVEVWP